MTDGKRPEIFMTSSTADISHIAFDDSIAERLGPATQLADFPDEDLTPVYKPFGNTGSADYDIEPAIWYLTCRWKTLSEKLDWSLVAIRPMPQQQ
jgi:hypothetical protein